MENFFEHFKRKPWLWLVVICFVIWLWMLIALAEMPLSNPFLILTLTGMGVLLLGLLYYFCTCSGSIRNRFVAIGLAVLMVGSSIVQTGRTGEQKELFETICSMPEELNEQGGFYAYSQAPVSSLGSMKDGIIGYIPGRNQAIVEQGKAILEEQKSSAKLKEYATLPSLLKALKGQAIRAVLLGPADLELSTEFSGLEQIGKELSLIEPVTIDVPVPADEKTEKGLNDPYTLMVTVTMDDLSEDAYRSILTMVLAINPADSKAMSIILPENLWVDYMCQEGDVTGCLPGRTDKLAFSSIYTQQTQQAAVENIIGMDVDYSLKVDLASLSSLADILGPIEVENDTEFSSGSYLFNTGTISLGSAKARSFASYNHDFSVMDNDYGQRPERVLSALLSKLNLAGALSNGHVREILQNSLRTNLSVAQFNALLRMPLFTKGIDSLPQSVITGTQAVEYSVELTDAVPTFYIDPNSMEEARAAARAVLETKGASDGKADGEPVGNEKADGNPDEKTENEEQTKGEPQDGSEDDNAENEESV